MNTTRTKVAFVRFLSLLVRGIRGLFGLPSQAVFKRLNLNWNLDLTEAIDFCLFFLGNYEPELIDAYKKHLRPGDVVFDIGANIGAHTLPMADLIGENGKVHAFEATNFAFQKLKQNRELNPHLSNRLSIHHCLLTDPESKHVPQQVSASWSVKTSLDDPGRNNLDQGFWHSTKNAKVISLDSWAEENHIERLDAIKLDVDGNEVSVLLGAQKILAKFKPLIMVEFSPIHFEDREDTFAQQVEALTGLGYVFTDLDGKEFPQSATEIESMIPRGVLVNVLAQIPT